MSSNKFAIVIGCSYINNSSIPRLNGTIEDAINMANILNNLGYIITFMHDTEIPTSSLYPSRQNIQNTIAFVLQNAISGDDVVIFYAGHGTQILNNIIKYSSNIVQTNDSEASGQDEAIVPADTAFSSNGTINTDTLIVDDTLNSWLKFAKSGVRIFMMFDCCHSGTMCDLRYTYSYPDNIKSNIINVSDITKSFITEEIKDTNINDIKATVITLSACKDTEVSWEDYVNWNGTKSKKTQGLLTSSFIYNISSSTNSTKDIFKLLYYISMNLSNNKPSQHPKISSNVPLHDPINDNNRYILNNIPLIKTPIPNVKPPIPNVKPPIPNVKPPNNYNKLIMGSVMSSISAIPTANNIKGKIPNVKKPFVSRSLNQNNMIKFII